MPLSHHRTRLLGLSLFTALFITADAAAQDAAPQTESTAPDRWLLLCCGLPGDDGHRERLTGACQNIIAGAQAVLHVPPEQMRILAGDQEMQESLAGDAEEVGVCTGETVAASLRELSETVPANAGCWVILLGHAHLYDRSGQFNVLGPDFDQEQFAAWAKPITCREQVYWLTMPISGFWIKPLAAESRVIISATEADLEFTGTEMPYALGDLFVGEGEHQNLEDVDRDGSLSLLDLYLATNLEIHGRFQSMERLQTEHAQLEDNGDGRGSELQQPYLPTGTDEASEEDAPPDEDAPAEEDAPSESEEATEAEPSSDDDELTDDEELTDDGQPPVDDETAKTQQALPKPIDNPILDGFRSRHILIRKPE